MMDGFDLELLLLEMQISGFCILEEVIPSLQCAKIRESVLNAVQTQRHQYPQAPKNIGFVPSIINHEQSFAEYLVDNRLMDLLSSLLGNHLRISFTSAIINEPKNERGDWHADWPFNQRNAGHIPAPYPDAVMHLTTLWMLSQFSVENGGTLILPGSHRHHTNPTATDGTDARMHLKGESNVTGSAGSVLIMDSRLWHASSPNHSSVPRVALAVRYAPWWLNLEVLRPESEQRRRMCDESEKAENLVPSISRDVYARLPERVQPLYEHWLEKQ